MGNDGGSIPGRQELVKTKKQKRHLQKDLMAKARSTMCALTKEALRSPVVVCWLGFLFNKEALLEALVLKKLPPFFKSYITSHKDFKELKTELKPTPDGPTLSCAITQQEYNGFHS